MSKVNVSIAVDDEHLQQMPEVVRNLQAAGLQVEQSMEQLGVITGLCEQTQVEVLAQVEGVAHVEPLREYQLAPPDADIQ